MNTYIMDKLGNTYTFKKLSFNDNLTIQGEVAKIKDLEVDKQIFAIVDVFKNIFAKSNPNYDMTLFEENIVDYNYEEIGIENFIKLINMVLDEVFQSKGTNTNKYPFLQETQE